MFIRWIFDFMLIVLYNTYSLSKGMSSSDESGVGKSAIQWNSNKAFNKGLPSPRIAVILSECTHFLDSYPASFLLARSSAPIVFLNTGQQTPASLIMYVLLVHYLKSLAFSIVNAVCLWYWKVSEWEDGMNSRLLETSFILHSNWRWISQSVFWKPLLSTPNFLRIANGLVYLQGRSKQYFTENILLMAEDKIKYT